MIRGPHELKFDISVHGDCGEIHRSFEAWQNCEACARIAKRILASGNPKVDAQKFLHEIEIELTGMRNRDQTPLERQLYVLFKHLRDRVSALVNGGGLDPDTIEACAKVAEGFLAGKNPAEIAAAIRLLNETAPKTET